MLLRPDLHYTARVLPARDGPGKLWCALRGRGLWDVLGCLGVQGSGFRAFGLGLGLGQGSVLEACCLWLTGASSNPRSKTSLILAIPYILCMVRGHEKVNA